MGFKFVWLWTDVALWAMFAAALGYALHVRRNPALRATWLKVLRDPAAVSAGLVLLLVTVTDLEHKRIPDKAILPAIVIAQRMRTSGWPSVCSIAPSAR